MHEETLRYSKDHEWIRVDGDTVYMGISDYAQLQMGDIVFVELPELEIEIERGETVCAVESVKTAADIFAPVSGEIIAVNNDLDERPELINEEPYKAWIVKIKMSDKTELDNLMDEAAYEEFCENEE